MLTIRIQWDFWVHKWTPEAVIGLVNRQLGISLVDNVDLNVSPPEGRQAWLVVKEKEGRFSHKLFTFAFLIQSVLHKEFQIVSEIQVKNDCGLFDRFEPVGQMLDRDLYAAVRREKNLERTIQEVAQRLKRSRGPAAVDEMIKDLETAIKPGHS